MSVLSVLRGFAVSAAAALAVLVSASHFPLSAQDGHRSSALPQRINAQYNVELGAFNLGQFKFEQLRHGNTYSLKSVVELSALLGAFEWRGVTTTSGLISDGAPTPKNYAFDYQSKGRGGLVWMNFEKGNVVRLSALPQMPVSGPMVALKKQHTQSVLDPLTAILHLAQPQGASPCGQTLPIFDGKQRFNLTFNFRRYEALPAVNGHQSRGIVCQIKYTPIGGYAPTGDTMKYAAEDNIEIAFRAVSSGQSGGSPVMVPYRLSLPTMVGTARLELTGLSVGAQRARMASAQR